MLEYTVTDMTATTVTLQVNNGQKVAVVSGDPVPNLTNGTYSVTLTVEAVDEAGNFGSDEIVFTVDTEAPVVTISSPVNGIYLNTQTPTLTFYSDEGGTTVAMIPTASQQASQRPKL